MDDTQNQTQPTQDDAGAPQDPGVSGGFGGSDTPTNDVPPVGGGNTPNDPLGDEGGQGQDDGGSEGGQTPGEAPEDPTPPANPAG